MSYIFSFLNYGKNLAFIRFIIESGNIKTVIDKCFPLSKAVEVHRYVEEGRKSGAVVIKVRQ
ncbi:MAG: zinc-binding dehydrogenase [Ignavibacteria bacterium]